MSSYIQTVTGRRIQVEYEKLRFLCHFMLEMMQDRVIVTMERQQQYASDQSMIQ